MEPQFRQHTIFIVSVTILITLSICRVTYADTQNLPDPTITKLEEGTSTAQAWWWGWAGTYAVLTVGQGVVALVASDRDLRINMLVGSASSLLGFGFVLITDFPARYAIAELDEMPDDTAEERTAKQNRARELLRASAQAEIDGRSWIIHFLGLSVAVAQGLVLWLAFDLPVDGAINAGISLAISEAQIWTQPTRAIDDWQAISNNNSELQLSIMPYPCGIGVSLSF